MADAKQIGLEAVFDNEDFQRGISAYNRDVDDASAGTEDASSTMSFAWEGLAVVGQAAFAAIVAGIAAMSAELFLAVDAALDAEQVLARMEFVVGNVGERTGVTSDEVLVLADNLSKVVPIDDEVITSAITMGLTFDGVNKDNIQPLIAAAADLSIWTGKDLPGTMKELALAISDPDKAMRLFRDANITLTDEQKKTLKSMGDMGDTAGVTSFILTQLTDKGIIGLGEAMADTGRGKFTIMQTAIGNLQEALGTGLLDSLKGVFDKITEFANDPKVIGFFTDLGTRIGSFAETVLDKLPSVMEALQAIADWFSENQALIVGILAALGVALLAFGIIAAQAAISALVGFAPIIAVLALIGAGAALLFTAWTEDWGGIQGKVAEVWAVLEPIFDSLVAWLEENIPIAIQFLSDLWTTTLLPAIQEVFNWIVANLVPLFISLVQWLQVNVPIAIDALSAYWSGTLLPAIQAVWAWIQSDLIPLFQSIVEWLSVNVPLAIQTLADFWTGVLLPAIMAVWTWLSTVLFPLFQAIADLMSAVLGVAITALAGLWQNILLPALQEIGTEISTVLSPAITAISSFITATFQPAFAGLAGIVSGTLLPALKPLSEFLGSTLKAAFDGITTAIQTLTGWIGTLTDALNSVELPPELTPGSPTPFEIGLRGINEQLAKLSTTELPAVAHEMNVLANVRDVPGANSAASSNSAVTNTQATNNYLFGASFNVNNTNSLLDILNGLK